jgi:1-acyl-sn-glycerol-3-phosphate acyltransferase
MSENTVHLESIEETNLVEKPEQPSVGFTDYFFTILFGVSFLILLICWDLVQRTAFYLCGEKALHRVDRTLNWLILTLLKLTGASFNTVNPFVFSNEHSYILVSNHQSMFDISMLHEVVWNHTPRFIAKKELGKWIPGISFNLRAGGQLLIDRSNAKEALQAIDKFAERLEAENFAAVIFPEGTRARNGVLKKFKPSGLMTLLKNAPNAKVIVATVDGSWRFQTFNCWPIPMGSKVQIEVIDVIERKPDLTPEEIISRSESLISGKLSALRQA